MAGKLTIGMATYDDFEGVFYTIQALRMFHEEVMHRVEEIVVVDNNPESADGKATKSFVQGGCKGIGRYVPYTERKGSCPPRGHLFDVATGDYVLCIDSHVFLAPGALKALIDYYDEFPETSDLIHGPLISGSLQRLEATHMNPVWRSEMYGTWAVDDRVHGDEPFEIPQHGLGLFSCRKAAWLGFNPRFNGFSGGEGYIHEKFRQAGNKVLCHPKVQWMHKFPRPRGCPHNPRLDDKIKNHIIGWNELGLDLTPIWDHFVRGIGTRSGKGRIQPQRMRELMRASGVRNWEPGADPRGTKQRGVIIGPTSWGSYLMRGKPIQELTKWPQINSRGKVELTSKFDTGLVIKADIPPVVRQKCDRVIWSPLDLWFGDRKQMEMEPQDWIKAKYDRLPFDDIIVENPYMAQIADAVLPRGVTVHMLPHHADHRIPKSWGSQDGPIVYAGHRCFFERYEPVFREAAKELGHELICDYSAHAWRSLEGASLVLAVRCPPYDTAMNRAGKPAVKVANAAAAGIPVLATEDPAIVSLYPDVITVLHEHLDDQKQVELSLSTALGSRPPARQSPLEEYVAKMKEIIG